MHLDSNIFSPFLTPVYLSGTRNKYKMVLSLSKHGYIQGQTITDKATGTPLCDAYTNVRYALPPQRWRRAIPLPESYSYGTRENPGDCRGVVGTCPQPALFEAVDESTWTEDCFALNVYIPRGDAPEHGWPILFFIHGGWLQSGSPNTINPAALIGDTESPVQAIVVAPAYRLGVFGFLYGSELELDAQSANETTGNHGFWDQRLALEWTREMAVSLGGDPSNLTISGYSAGAYSVFYQLAYDLRQPTQTIRQACIFSNAPGVQPKQPPEAQTQFDALLAHLDIPPDTSLETKLQHLRDTPAPTLLTHATSTAYHQYRPTVDGAFIDTALFANLHNGVFAQECRKRGIRFLLGECRDEPKVYSQWFPPGENTLDALRERFYAEYPRAAVDTFLEFFFKDGEGGSRYDNFNEDAFGSIYADMQVYLTQRGLIHDLFHGLELQSQSQSQSQSQDSGQWLYRYRIEHRLNCTPLPPEWGVTHSSDMVMWFWGNDADTSLLSAWEKQIVRRALLGPLATFLDRRGGDLDWVAKGRDFRVLRSDGEVGVVQDERWDEAGSLWKLL